MEISNTSKMLAGVILVTVPTIEYGGSFLLGMLRRAEPDMSITLCGTTCSGRATPMQA